MSARKTERLLNLLIALLSTRRGYTREELRQLIEPYRQSASEQAFERTFERDKDELRELGIPIETVSDDVFFDADQSAMRYRVDKDRYSLPQVRFTAEESTVLGLASRLWQQASLGSAASRAIRKLRSRGVATEDAESAGIEPRIRPHEPAFEPVLQAILNRRQVDFRYHAASTGKTEPRRVYPWGIGSRFGRWYLVGWDLDRRGQRMFRLSRIITAVHDVAPSGGGYEIPEGFDIAASLDALAERGETKIATLLLRPGTAAALRTRGRQISGTPESAKSGTSVSGSSGPVTAVPSAAGTGIDAGTDHTHGGEWDVVEHPYTDVEVLAEEVAALGPNVLVPEAGELRDTVWRRIQGAARSQSEPSSRIDFPDHPPAAARHKFTSTDHLTRLLDMVPYLLEHPGSDLDSTARQFGIGTGQLVKDLQLLFVCGLPGYGPEDLIDASWDDGAIFLDNAEELSQPVRLGVDEACALLVGLQALAGLPGLGASTALHSAQAKISAVVGDRGAVQDSVRAQIEPSGLSELLAHMQTAVDTAERLHLRYLVPHRDEITERAVDPLRLFSADNVWYMDAYCHRAQGRRNFRLDRIQAWEPTGEHHGRQAQRDSEFPAELFTPSDDDVLVTLVLSPRGRWVAEYYRAERTAELDDGMLAAELRVGSTAWLPSLVTRVGGDVRVVAGADVASAAAAWADAALANYGPSGGS